jgi:hypothetical protein
VTAPRLGDAGGRFSKLTPERSEAILTAVEQGSYLKVALAAGVHKATLHRWLANGSAAQSRADAGETLGDDEEAYRTFRESVTRAQARAETLLVASWQAAAFGPDGDWRAARDMLARMAPERWAGVTRIQMTNEETERRLDDAVTEALLLLGLGHSDTETDDDDLPRETDEEPPR